jgi:hypothetical protein
MTPGKRTRYISASIGAVILVVFGAIIVINRAGDSPINTNGGLNIKGVIVGDGPTLPISVSPSPTQPSGGVNVPYTHVKATTTPSPSPVSPNQVNNISGFDWNTFVATLSHHTGGSATTSSSGPTIADAYAFIPTGLFSPSQPKSAQDIPDNEKDLYGWGQSAGGAIQSFEESHPNQSQILTDFIQDRQNPAKIAAMKKLGGDLIAVGDDIAQIDPTPSQLKTAAPALAAAYRDIGQKLAAIPDAAGDSATVQAILTYDKSAEAFVGKFVTVVTIINANGIKYAQSEPGGAFMMPSQ